MKSLIGGVFLADRKSILVRWENHRIKSRTSRKPWSYLPESNGEMQHRRDIRFSTLLQNGSSGFTVPIIRGENGEHAEEKDTGGRGLKHGLE
jgi:hypothetical protein